MLELLCLLWSFRGSQEGPPRVMALLAEEQESAPAVAMGEHLGVVDGNLQKAVAK